MEKYRPIDSGNRWAYKTCHSKLYRYSNMTGWSEGFTHVVKSTPEINSTFNEWYGEICSSNINAEVDDPLRVFWIGKFFRTSKIINRVTSPGYNHICSTEQKHLQNGMCLMCEPNQVEENIRNNSGWYSLRYSKPLSFRFLHRRFAINGNTTLKCSRDSLIISVDSTTCISSGNIFANPILLDGTPGAVLELFTTHRIVGFIGIYMNMQSVSTKTQLFVLHSVFQEQSAT